MSKTASKSIHKWRRYPSSTLTKLTKKCGSELDAQLWCHVTPQRKTTIWVHNCSPSRAQKPPTYFGKFTFCTTFGVHKLVRFEPFLDPRCKIWKLLPAIYSDVLKKLYRCTFTFLALNYCGGIFFKSLSYLFEVVRTNFSTDFWTSQFLTTISQNLWRRLATKWVPCTASQRQIKSTYKPSVTQHLFKLRTPRTYSPLASEHDMKKTNTTFLHLQLARVVRSSPNFARW